MSKEDQLNMLLVPFQAMTSLWVINGTLPYCYYNLSIMQWNIVTTKCALHVDLFVFFGMNTEIAQHPDGLLLDLK